MPVPQRVSFFCEWGSQTGKMPVPQRVSFFVSGDHKQARCLFHKE
ncbi:hypothetical protein [Microcoleus vaginatus]